MSSDTRAAAVTGVATPAEAGRDEQGREDANDQHTGARRSKPAGPAPSVILPPPSDPMAVARFFVERDCAADGAPRLRRWRGVWWRYFSTHWEHVEDESVEALLYRFTENGYYSAESLYGVQFVKWLPNRRKIGDLLQALASVVFLSGKLEQPCWLDGRVTGPIIAVQNGLLDLVTRQFYPHSASFFGSVAVPFDYDAGALPPGRWLKFLNDLWPADREPDGEAPATKALAEWCGYVISGRAHLHKIALMVGPTRGGKGVSARVLTRLIGADNVCSPTLTSLGGEFGLTPLIGKSLALVSDSAARARIRSSNGCCRSPAEMR